VPGTCCDLLAFGFKKYFIVGDVDMRIMRESKVGFTSKCLSSRTPRPIVAVKDSRFPKKEECEFSFAAGFSGYRTRSGELK
jgi:hypothetical protein